MSNISLSNNKIYLSFLKALFLYNICLFNNDYKCKLKTFYRGKTDKRLEIKINNHKEFNSKCVLTLFITGNHNTPRHHYTIENPHILNLIYEGNKNLLDDEEKLKRFIKFLAYFDSIWKSCVEFDSEELYDNIDPNIDTLIEPDKKYLEIFNKYLNT